MLGAGITMCKKVAASSAQDCNTDPPNPGGGFCCLEIQEGGSGGAVGAGSDGGEPNQDAATTDRTSSD
jgi:hypothetical protein